MDVALKLRAEYAPLRAAEIAGVESVEQLRALIQRLNTLHNQCVVETTRNQAGAQVLRNLAKSLEIDLSDKTIEAMLAPILKQHRDRFGTALEGSALPEGTPVPASPKGPPTGGGALAREPKARPSPTAMDRRPEPEPRTEDVAEVATSNGASKPPPAPPRTVPDAPTEPPVPLPPPPPGPRIGVERLGRTPSPASPPAADAPPPPPPTDPPPAEAPGAGEEAAEPPPKPIAGTISVVTDRARRAMALVAKPKKGAQNRSDAMVDPETGERIPADECYIVDDLTPDVSEAGGDVTIHAEE